jgi:hypothetical protein
VKEPIPDRNGVHCDTLMVNSSRLTERENHVLACTEVARCCDQGVELPAQGSRQTDVHADLNRHKGRAGIVRNKEVHFLTPFASQIGPRGRDMNLTLSKISL